MERLVLEFVIRAGLTVLTTALLLRALRIRTAAAQHALWAGVLMVMLALPIWMSWGPKAALPVLPAREEPAVVVMSASPPRVDVSEPAIPAPFEIPETPEARPPFWNWNAMLIGTYLLGACALLLRLGIGTIRANRLTSASCVVPVTVGLLRPRVLLPERCSEWPELQLNAVLTHERTHARRHDPLFQWLALFNRAVFWFHPLAWWLERRLSALAEEACDAAVLEGGHDPRDCSEYLLELARAVQRAGTRVNALGMAMPGSYLPQRVKKIIDGVRAPRISPMRMACAVLACGIPVMVFAAGTLDRAPEILRLRPLAAWPLPQLPILLSQAPALPQQAPAYTAPPIFIAVAPAPPQQVPAVSMPAKAEGELSFEVASVKANKSDARPYSNIALGPGRLFVLTGGLFSATNFPLYDYLKFAYPSQFVVDPQVPEWTRTERFDIQARAQGNPTKDQLRSMMRSLLADRFSLSLHKETRQVSGFVLTLLKPGMTGPDLKPRPANSPCSGMREPGEGGQMVAGTRLPVTCGDFFAVRPCPPGRLCGGARDVTMGVIAAFIASKFLRPVFDQTGLSGTFDMNLERTPTPDLNDPMPPGMEPDPSGPTIQDAIKNQLGLKLGSSKGPIEKLVVDHLERPSEN